jgi:hypothetical protein
MLKDTVKVSIKADFPDAVIRYTTDGTDPDSTSAVYDKPLLITKPLIIKAISTFGGYYSSFIQSAFFDFIDSERNGLNYNYYAGEWMKLPDFTKLQVVKTGTVYEIGLDKIIPTQDEFALSFTGSIKIEKQGDYEFFIRSNDGSRFYIDNHLIIDHDGPHGADIEKTGKIVLTKGMHPLKLEYFQAGGGMFLQLQYAGPGFQRQTVPSTVLFKK